MESNLLRFLGEGLRGAGAIFSPQVYEAQNQERAQFEQVKEQRNKMLADQTIRAIENGSLDPAKGRAVLDKLGMGDMAVGPSMQTLKYQSDMGREQKLLQIRAGAKQKAFGKPVVNTPVTGEGSSVGGDISAPAVTSDAPNTAERQRAYADELISSGEQELVKEGSDLIKTLREKDETYPPLVKYQQARAKAVSQYGEGHPVVKQLDAMIAKMTSEAGGGSGTQYERALETLQRLQLQVEGGAQLTREQELQAQSARTILEQQRPFIDPVTQKLGVSQPITVPPSMTVGATGKPTPNVMPSMSGGRRPLDAGTEKKFTDLGSGFSQIQSVIAGFKNDYGGFVSETAGNLAIEAGRRGLPKYKDMAVFWQQYEQWASDVRAEKFGLTLTGNELINFKKYRALPSDTPEVIRENIKRQFDIYNAAAQRMLNGLNESGQNVKQGEALSGIKKGQKVDQPPEVRGVNTEQPEGKPLEFDKKPDPNDFDEGDVLNGPEGTFTLKIIDGQKQWVK